MYNLANPEISWSRTNQTAQTHQGEGYGGRLEQSAPRYFKLGLEYPLAPPPQKKILYP